MIVMGQRDKGIWDWGLLYGRAAWGLVCYLWAFTEVFSGCLGDYRKVGNRTVGLVLHRVSEKKCYWPVKTPRVL